MTFVIEMELCEFGGRQQFGGFVTFCGTTYGNQVCVDSVRVEASWIDDELVARELRPDWFAFLDEVIFANFESNYRAFDELCDRVDEQIIAAV